MYLCMYIILFTNIDFLCFFYKLSLSSHKSSHDFCPVTMKNIQPFEKYLKAKNKIIKYTNLSPNSRLTKHCDNVGKGDKEDKELQNYYGKATLICLNI